MVCAPSSFQQLMQLKGCTDYCGGLDTEGGADGEYTYAWKGEATQVCVCVWVWGCVGVCAGVWVFGCVCGCVGECG